MKTLMLCSINARFIHTSLAVRYISRYIEEYVPSVKTELCEWTISQPAEQIIRGAVEARPDMLLFSVYIWNCELTFRVIREIRKLLPDILIGAGGPEVSYQAAKILGKEKALDFIISGEGEQTAAELAAALDAGRAEKAGPFPAEIPGIWYMQQDGTPVFTGLRPLITNLDSIPFPYTGKNGNIIAPVDPVNQIVYYESARGCPFRCAYCLSSLDKQVRYFSLKRVFSDLSFFLRGGYTLVKFVDRTFNLDPERYMNIWKYILDNYNGITTFHFEISAQLLSEEALELLANAPPGAVQFEIGIQSTNRKTLARVGRNTDPEQEAAIIRRIPAAIHTHLDLIAGLPGEDILSYRRSFDETIVLRPQMLQNGFLKILSGTAMEDIARKEGYLYQEAPPYEVLETPDLPCTDLFKLKDIEHIADIYYNSGSFRTVMEAVISGRASIYIDGGKLYSRVSEIGNNMPGLPHLEEPAGPFDFFSGLSRLIAEQGSLYLPRKLKDYFAFLSELFTDNPLMTELLRFDFLLNGKAGAFPPWYKRRYDKAAHDKVLRTHTEIRSVRESYSHSDWEQFSWNPLTGKQGETALLILYNPPLSARALDVTGK